jgi:hypothetical protein
VLLERCVLAAVVADFVEHGAREQVRSWSNSSMVLGFEFLESKRVVLFVGNAQVGNWLSWENVKWTVDPAVGPVVELNSEVGAVQARRGWRLADREGSLQYAGGPGRSLQAG